MSENFLERVWAYREEKIYPELFGDLGPGIFTLDGGDFQNVFQRSPDPRWLFTGVFECPPCSKHADWVYVSSGLSNPWEQEEPKDLPDQPSWLGIEFIFRTTEQGPWAIRMVQRIVAYEILLAHDQFEGYGRLGFGDRVPLRGPIDPGSESALTYLLIAPPADFPKLFQLESGGVDFVQLVGISEAEAAFGRENGLDALIQLLADHDAYVITNPRRKSIV
ncbi:MAG TPA: suppressor of fused domain protein [Pyrinomonadaceae bacterium]